MKKLVILIKTPKKASGSDFNSAFDSEATKKIEADTTTDKYYLPALRRPVTSEHPIPGAQSSTRHAEYSCLPSSF